MNELRIVVRTWATRGGRYYYKLYRHSGGYGYDGEGSGGNLGDITEAAAIEIMLSKVRDAKLDGINMKLIS